MHALLYTLPKKENTVARDLCDCLYPHDPGVRCVALATGRVYVEASRLDVCLGLNYFQKLVKKVEYFDEVSSSPPSCVKCEVVEVGGLYFIRRVV
ncbi:MAG: DUF3195 domain-containing protein [Pyrobaculum sp.]